MLTRSVLGPYLVLLLAAGVTACTSRAMPPNEQLALGQASIEAALGSGAAQVAPAELLRAREKMASAQQALQAGHPVQARRLAEQADVDAQLAQAKADAAKSARASQEVEASLQTLREELQQSEGSTSPGLAPSPAPAPSRP